MEAVRTLKELVIFTLIRCKYKKSRLPAMISNIAYKERKFGEYATDDDKEILYRTIRRICEHWAIPGKLSYIKNRIAVCFRGLVLEILQYASELAQAIKQYNTTCVTLCVDSICLTQNGRINKAKTLLTILTKSEFLLEINHGQLFHNFVMKKDLIDATNDVLNAIKNKPNSSRVAKIKTNIEKALDYNDLSLIASDYFAETQGEDEGRTVKTAAFALLLSKDHEGVRRVCDMMTIENRIKFLKDNEQWYIGDNRYLSGEMIEYLSLKLPSDEWIEILKKYHDMIFNVLIFDWRSRGFAVNVFKHSLDFIDLKLIKKILGFASSMYDDDQGSEDHDSFANTERIQVLKSIWINTPLQLRHDVKQHLKSTEAVDYNADFLNFVLESYPVSDQAEILNELMKNLCTRQFTRFSEYDKIFKIYTCLETNSESMFVDADIVTTFKEVMNVLNPKKKKN